jgi:hypothetical protein
VVSFVPNNFHEVPRLLIEEMHVSEVEAIVDGSRRQDIAHRASCRGSKARSRLRASTRTIICRHRIRIPKPQGLVLD